MSEPTHVGCYDSRVQCVKMVFGILALTLPKNPVAQTFLSAGSGDFPVASPCSSAENAGQECPANSRTGMSTLRGTGLSAFAALDGGRRCGQILPPTTLSENNKSPYNAAVIGREEINPQLLVLRVQPDAAMFDFKPGQFGVLGLLGREPRVPEAASEEIVPEPDKMIRRAYSIASSSVERRYVEFYLTLITSGQLTPRLFALKHGSPLFLGPKASGVFTLDRVPPGKAVVLIAT